MSQVLNPVGVRQENHRDLPSRGKAFALPQEENPWITIISEQLSTYEMKAILQPVHPSNLALSQGKVFQAKGVMAKDSQHALPALIPARISPSILCRSKPDLTRYTTHLPAKTREKPTMSLR